MTDDDDDDARYIRCLFVDIFLKNISDVRLGEMLVFESESVFGNL